MKLSTFSSWQQQRHGKTRTTCQKTRPVRVRVKGHIERVFPTAKTFTDTDADYRYRAFIDRTEVAKVVADRLLAIDYDNFKDSVEDDQLHVAYLKVWGVMEKLQH